MPYSAVEIAEYSRKIGKSRSTLFKWISEGCDLRNPKSVQEWVTRNTIRETNISKARKRRAENNQKAQRSPSATASERSEPVGNGDLPPAGKLGAAALDRLERAEEESHRRLLQAQAARDAITIQAAADLWLKTATTRPLGLRYLQMTRLR